MFDSASLCAEHPWLNHYINICKYTVPELAILFVGTLFWVIVYYIVIRGGFKNKYVEMPVPAAASNLAWEFSWAFLYITDLGSIFVWGLRVWFFMDLFIFYAILKYGTRQLAIPQVIKYFKPIEILSVIGWVIAFYYFIKEGYDTSMGATSAYIITVIMALLYIVFFLSSNYQHCYSFTAAWCKMAGNTLMSVFVILHYKELIFLQFLTVIVFILDLIYVILTYRRKHAL